MPHPPIKHILMALFLACGAADALACSCEGEESVKNAIKHSDAVFSGVVISKTFTNNVDSLGVTTVADTNNTAQHQLSYAVVTFKIDKMHKGKIVSDTIIILTPKNSGACGYNFEVGQKYIVYATQYDGVAMLLDIVRRANGNKIFWTNLCTSTKLWDATEENEILSLKKRKKRIFRPSSR